jgi:hypothetical protein
VPNVRLSGSEKRIFDVFISREFIICRWMFQWWLKHVMTPVWRYTENNKTGISGL